MLIFTALGTLHWSICRLNEMLHVFFHLRIVSKSPAEISPPICAVLELCSRANLPCLLKLALRENTSHHAEWDASEDTPTETRNSTIQTWRFAVWVLVMSQHPEAGYRWWTHRQSIIMQWPFTLKHNFYTKKEIQFAFLIKKYMK